MTSISAGRDLDAILRRARVVLLDFDGPVCAVFAGLGDATVAPHLRASLDAAGYPTNGIDDLGPHSLLVHAAISATTPHTSSRRRLAAAELDAIMTAAPTPGAGAFLAACTETQRPVVIASNNNAKAIAAYVDRHPLGQLVTTSKVATLTTHGR